MRREPINNARGAIYVKIGCNGRTFIGIAQSRQQAWSIAIAKITKEAEKRVTKRRTLTLRQA